MRTPTGGFIGRFRAFAGPWRTFLPAAFFRWTLCVCFAASSLPLPHPIPPPAEDDPPPKVSAPAKTTTDHPATSAQPTQSQPAQSQPVSRPSVTTAPATSPATSSATAPATSAPSATARPQGILVRSTPLKDSSGKVIPMNGNYGGGTILLPAAYTAKPNEFRGVWVATAFNLDFAKHATTAEFQASYRALVARLADMGFNTIMFQVRLTCDAIYKSPTNPWSRWLTGEEGRALDGGFDPLPFMISEARRRGLKFYAWMNPYRVGQVGIPAASTYLSTLSRGSFARRNPGMVVRWNDKKTNLAFFFLDPGRAEVVAHIVNSVREVLQYRPDGIVFDDYFYPIGVDDTCDAVTYGKFAKKGQSLADWRRANTELLIRSVAGTVRAFNRLNGTSIPFGVSPVGIWANRSQTCPEGSPSKGVEAYSQSFADVRKWVVIDWIDFVIPQVNWGLGNRIAPFAGIVNWWSDLVRGTNVKLYVGIGVYQAGVAAGEESPSELANQVLYLILRREVAGTVLFAARHCLNPQNNAQKTSLRTIFGSYWRPSAR